MGEPVGTFKQPDYNDSGQSGTGYPLAIDASIKAMRRLANPFAPHEQSTPNMTVRVDAGFINDDAGFYLDVAAQSTGTITAPASNPRIDRVVLNAFTGAAAVLTGVEAASPVPPTIPLGFKACAKVTLATSTTTITNSIMEDERQQPPNPTQVLATYSLFGAV